MSSLDKEKRAVDENRSGAKSHSHHENSERDTDMPVVEVVDRRVNLKYIRDSIDELKELHPGEFVVIVAAGTIIKSFPTRAEARGYVDSLAADLAPTAVIWFVDDPEEVYAV